MKDPNLASEQKKNMSLVDAYRVDIQATMQEVTDAARRSDKETVHRLTGTCVAAASKQMEVMN